MYIGEPRGFALVTSNFLMYKDVLTKSFSKICKCYKIYLYLITSCLFVIIESVMPIKLLSQNLINQIAAGEVIERPSSVLKELMENAIDAGADKIIVKLMDAGKSFISVSDNGSGMDAESLKMCIMSHATSKLSDDNLFNIHTMGFRGEALPSIVSISRVTITSSTDGEEGHKIQLEGAECVGFSPASCAKGTTVEVHDLFFATPARLKFLKSDSIEMDHCNTLFDRIALAHKNVTFEFFDGKRRRARYEKTDELRQRVADVCGEQFNKNIFTVNKKVDGLHLYGFLGVPTFNKSSNNYQYFFVNNRFVKDRIFFSALKSAYLTLVPAGRYPVAILYLDIDPGEIDVNVHPTKTEIRFRNDEKVRSFMVTTLRNALSGYGATRVSSQLVDKFSENLLSSREIDADEPWVVTKPSSLGKFSRQSNEDFFADNGTLVSDRDENFPAMPKSEFSNFSRSAYSPNFSRASRELLHDRPVNSFESDLTKKSGTEDASNFVISTSSSDVGFLGHAVCQIHDTYIVAVHEEDLIIIDQHAAAERITLEKLKKNTILESQNLLMPDACTLTHAQVECLDKNADFLNSFGIHFAKAAEDVIIINALPAILETSDAKGLVMDIIDELMTFSDAYSLEEKVHKVLSTMSCHGSLRANHRLSIEEMDSLLRQMEQTPNIGQCCHGRPSYVVLSLKDLNKFFERT